MSNSKPKIEWSSIYLVVFSVMLAGYALALLPEEIFVPLIAEDGPVEYLTAGFFLVPSLAFFLLFASKHFIREKLLEPLLATRGRRYVFLLLALVLFFGFGEEISWGQRLFGFETPAAIAERNSQREFNFHNLEIFDVKNVEGERKGTLAKLFTMKQLFIYCFSAYLLIIPLLYRKNGTFKELFDRWYIPVPALSLGILFVINYVIYRLLRLITDGRVEKVISHGLTEVQELHFSLVLLCLPFIWMRSPFQRHPAPAGTGTDLHP